MRLILFTFIALLLPGFVLAQYTISGKIVDQATKEPLTGANIVFKDASYAATTDLNGTFTINDVAEGTYTIRISGSRQRPKVKFHPAE